MSSRYTVDQSNNIETAYLAIRRRKSKWHTLIARFNSLHFTPSQLYQIRFSLGPLSGIERIKSRSSPHTTLLPENSYLCYRANKDVYENRLEKFLRGRVNFVSRSLHTPRIPYALHQRTLSFGFSECKCVSFRLSAIFIFFRLPWGGSFRIFISASDRILIKTRSFHWSVRHLSSQISYESFLRSIIKNVMYENIANKHRPFCFNKNTVKQHELKN